MKNNSKWIGIGLLGLALIIMAWHNQDQAARMKRYQAQQAKLEAAKAKTAAEKAASTIKVETTASTNAGSSAATSSSSESLTAISTPSQTGSALAVRPVNRLEPEVLYVLENAFLKVDFTSRGGAIRSIALKKYPAVLGSKEPCVLQAPETLPFGALNFTERTDGNDLNNYRLVSQTADSITFARTIATGIALERRYTLTRPDPKAKTASGYIVKQTLSWHNVSNTDLQLPAYSLNIGTAIPSLSDPQNLFLDFGTFDGKNTAFKRLSFFKGGGFLFWSSPAQSIFEQKTSTAWASVDSQFFSMIGSPKTPAAGAFALPVMTDEKEGVKPLEAIAGGLRFEGPLVNAGSTVTTEVEHYFGPKEYSRLSTLSNRQDEVMQWGWPIFAFFSKMFISMLNWLAKAVHNYGMAIIALTLIIRAAMWPFTSAAAQASKKMAAVQPMLKEIQEKYKNSPEKLQRETLRIFQENQVNPLAGCLPALLQIPVFIGFFYMLRTAAELRFESFLWIKDLSMPDTIGHIGGFPINPLPVVMLITMWLQMKLTPSGADPEQQKIMQFTPLLFSFLLYNFSAGLTLYWTLSNVISIIQQLLVNRQGVLPTDKGGAGASGDVVDIKAETVK